MPSHTVPVDNRTASVDLDVKVCEHMQLSPAKSSSKADCLATVHMLAKLMTWT